MLLAPYVCFHIFSYVLVTDTEWSPIGKIAAHSALAICFLNLNCLLVTQQIDNTSPVRQGENQSVALTNSICCVIG